MTSLPKMNFPSSEMNIFHPASVFIYKLLQLFEMTCCVIFSLALMLQRNKRKTSSRRRWNERGSGGTWSFRPHTQFQFCRDDHQKQSKKFLTQQRAEWTSVTWTISPPFYLGECSHGRVLTKTKHSNKALGHVQDHWTAYVWNISSVSSLRCY